MQGNVRKALDDLVLVSDLAAVVLGVLLCSNVLVSVRLESDRLEGGLYAATWSSEQSSLQVTWTC